MGFQGMREHCCPWRRAFYYYCSKESLLVATVDDAGCVFVSNDQWKKLKENFEWFSFDVGCGQVANNISRLFHLRLNV